MPLRDVVVFPHMVIPLFVGRPKSIKALETAMEAGKSIMLVAQKTAAKDEPTAEEPVQEELDSGVTPSADWEFDDDPASYSAPI